MEVPNKKILNLVYGETLPLSHPALQKVKTEKHIFKSEISLKE